MDFLGRFITFEGGEGAGKSTLLKKMSAMLRFRDIAVIETREPGGTVPGQQLCQLIVEKESYNWSSMGEALLMFASRYEHIIHVIEPALKRGDWVVCDRFMDSTLAYQGGAGKLGIDFINKLQSLIIGQNFVPDLTFLLDVPSKIGLKRAKNKGRFEDKDIHYHEAVRRTFLYLAQNDTERIVTINATLPLIEIEKQAEDIINKRFFSTDF